MRITVEFDVTDGTPESKKAWLAGEAATRIGLALLEDFGPSSDPERGRRDGYEGPFIVTPVKLVADREIVSVSLDDVTVEL